MATKFLELFPGSSKIAKSAFESDDAYQKFRQEFSECLVPALREFDRMRAAGITGRRNPAITPIVRMLRRV